MFLRATPPGLVLLTLSIQVLLTEGPKVVHERLLSFEMWVRDQPRSMVRRAHALLMHA